MKRTFTRQELYDLVWSTPIATLAAQFEISDRGLAKTCERHVIPVPGRGYWAKIQAGQPATKTPLWTFDNPGLETVHIGGAKRAVNPYVAFAIEAANATVKAANAERPVKAARETPSAVTLPQKHVTFEPVRRPHASISGLAALLRAASPDDRGEIQVPGICVHRSSRARTIAVLHHLSLALEARSIVITHGDKGIKAIIEPDDVRLEINEGRRREKHSPTPSERKKEEDFQRRREIARRRGGWLSYERFWPEYDYIYSGKLTFEIANWADGARKRWSDGKHQTLESMIEAMADGVLFHLAFEKARREEREEQERLRQHMAHRRSLHKKRQEREEKRLEFLRRLADYQREAADLRVLIAEASTTMEAAAPEYRRMIAWAEARLAHLKAQNEIDALTANLQAQNLFPETDDLDDPEGDPPAPRYVWGD